MGVQKKYSSTPNETILSFRRSITSALTSDIADHKRDEKVLSLQRGKKVEFDKLNQSNGCVLKNTFIKEILDAEEKEGNNTPKMEPPCWWPKIRVTEYKKNVEFVLDFPGDLWTVLLNYAYEQAEFIVQEDSVLEEITIKVDLEFDFAIDFRKYIFSENFPTQKGKRNKEAESSNEPDVLTCSTQKTYGKPIPHDGPIPEFFAEEEEDQKIQALLLEEAETLVYTTEKVLFEIEEKVSKEKVKAVKHRLEVVQKELAKDLISIVALKRAVDALKEVAQKVATDLYKRSSR
jgi:hypothetical protein